jgi:hypothetical protein
LLGGSQTDPDEDAVGQAKLPNRCGDAQQPNPYAKHRRTAAEQASGAITVDKNAHYHL